MGMYLLAKVHAFVSPSHIFEYVPYCLVHILVILSCFDKLELFIFYLNVMSTTYILERVTHIL